MQIIYLYEIFMNLNFSSVLMHMINPVSHLLTDFVPQKSTARLIREVTLVLSIFTSSSYDEKILVKRLRAFTQGSFFNPFSSFGIKYLFSRGVCIL